MRKLFLFFALISSSLVAVAQTGSISGTVKDGSNNDPIIGANVIIMGTQTGAATDIEGKFILNNIKEGAYSIIITFITYKSDTIENIVVKSGQTAIVTSELREESKQLTEVVVSGQRDRSLESSLILDRKNSVQMVQGIGAQELSRKGVSDAEAAVVQITGVAKQDGVKNVFVRGLGDRYNSTSLNGLPLPSEDPQNKNITLDLFSSDVINSIDVNKTFTATMFGDVAGANINIKSKKLLDDQQLKVSLSGGVNSQAIGKDFYRADGTNFMGIASRDIPISNLDRYDFKDSYQPNKVSAPLINTGLSISGGKSFQIGGKPLRTFAVASMNNEYIVNHVIERQQSEGGIAKDLKSEKFEFNTSQLLMGNFSYELSSANTISYNVIYIHDNKQSVADYIGFNNKGNDDIEDPNAYKTFIRRQQQNNNATLVNQLLSEIKITDKINLDLAGSFNVATGDEPDRRTNFYIFDGTNHLINTGSPSYNNRYFSNLKETEFAGRAIVSYSLNKNTNNRISLGYNLRSTNRDFEATQFNFDFVAPVAVDINNPDAIFDQQSIDNGIFELETARGTASTALRPFTYSGNRLIHAGFVDAVYDITSNLTINAGVRMENFNQEVIWDTNLTKGQRERTKNYFLPSLNIKYSVSENDILRLASSQTYTFAQFKELAPFLYEDINLSSFGNADIKPSENFNLDLRYEHFFSAGELVALTGYYKSVKYPINRGLITSAANEFSYFNSSTDKATSFGAELEVRKAILNKSKQNGKISLDLGASLSYLYTKQNLEDVQWDKYSVAYTDKNSKLEGSSPLLINSDLTLTREGAEGNKFVATLLFNYNMERIYTLGAAGNQNINEVVVPKLDFISSYDINSHFSLGIKVKNMLNPSYQRNKFISTEHRDVLISDYKKGITTSFSISYKL